MANYRPISNLSYMSKVVERAVVSLTTNNLQPCFQSAYRKKHSTETAMLRVWSDILAAADQRQVTLLGLLDMSAAFDYVDHDLLLQRPHYSFGMTGAVLDWISCFLRKTHPANRLRRSAVHNSASGVWCSTRIRARAVVIRLIHRRTELCRGRTRSTSASIR